MSTVALQSAMTRGGVRDDPKSQKSSARFRFAAARRLRRWGKPAGGSPGNRGGRFLGGGPRSISAGMGEVALPNVGRKTLRPMPGTE